MRRATWVILMLCAASVAQAATPLVVGSKMFTENYILGEIAAQLLEARGYVIERRPGLNGTRISYAALTSGEISFYPEYTGTITEVILARPDLVELDDIRTALAGRGLRLLPPLGFNNSYALAVPAALADELGLGKISDLRGRELRAAFPHEFLSRPDGWPGLKAAYGLSFPARGIEHSLSYDALAEGKIDLTAVYSTDGEILRAGLRILEDDRGYFPQYLAAFLANDQLDDTAIAALAELAGRIDDKRMQALNLAVLDPDISIAQVAADFLAEEGLAAARDAGDPAWRALLRNTKRHLKLTGIALGFAVLFGVGIAVAVHRQPALSSAFLYFTGLLQTVPSIALLALMIPLLGVGQLPAIVALFLYSLLPIARSTITAMHAIPQGYRQVAAAMAMSRSEEMRYVLLPLAMPHVLSGIRTAAVICIGTATLAAFIGAGGLGDPIVTGLALNDTRLILQGALPAAGLAILTELAFNGLERVLVVPHMRAGERAN